ncbi:unnamed protein product, partial [Laminaria digitata]
VCGGCQTVSGPECLPLLELPDFCEGCQTDRCLICAMRRRPCDKCGQCVSVKHLRQAMAWHSSFVKKMPALCQDKEGDDPPHRQNVMRAEITQRWNDFVDGQKSPPSSRAPPPPTAVDAAAAATPA